MSIIDKIKAMFSGDSAAQDSQNGHDHSPAGHDHSHEEPVAPADPVGTTPPPVDTTDRP